MSPSQAHNPGCTVLSGSNGSSMPVEHNSKREKKIVSSGIISVILPGGGFNALSQISKYLKKKIKTCIGSLFCCCCFLNVTISDEILHEHGCVLCFFPKCLFYLIEFIFLLSVNLLRKRHFS